MRLAAVAIVLAAAATAAADPAPDPQVARADALFAEAQAKLAAGDLQGACAKFDESLKLNSAAIGTLLNVARCDARLGKLAHAVTLFTDARDRGREQNLPAYVKAAEDQLAELTPLVPHLKVAITEPLPGMTIVIDDAAVALDASGDVALDPGPHSITVSAPDRVPYQTRMQLANAEHKTLSIPALAHPTTIVRGATSARRRAGQIVTASGGAIVATSIIIGVIAHSQYSDALKLHCNNDADHCNAAGFSSTQDAQSLGNVGTIIGIAGVATAAVGVVLWLRAPREAEARGIAVAPVASPELTGIVATGHF